MPQVTKRVSIPWLTTRKGKEPLTMLTAYDAPTARLVDGAGVDMILVGDSLAMVVLGYETTLEVTVDEMLHHTRAVTRVRERALVIGDMPYLSYQITDEEGVRKRRSVHQGGGSGRGQDRGRRVAHPPRRTPPRGRDPRDGSHRPDAAVLQRPWAAFASRGDRRRRRGG